MKLLNDTQPEIVNAWVSLSNPPVAATWSQLPEIRAQIIRKHEQCKGGLKLSLIHDLIAMLLRSALHEIYVQIPTSLLLQYGLQRLKYL